MGSNLVLLESLEEGALLEDAPDWLGIWFKEVRKWSPGEIDNERLTWVRCYGIPVHAWNNDFFRSLVFGTGEFLNVDDNTEKRKTMDVARILIRTRVHEIINFVVKSTSTERCLLSRWWKTGTGHCSGVKDLKRK